MVSMLVIIVIIIGTQWVIIMRPSMLVIIMIVIAIALGDHIFPQFPPPDTQQQLSFHCSEQTRERHGSSRLVNRRLNGCFNVLFVKWCSIVKKYDLLNCIIKFVNLPGH